MIPALVALLADLFTSKKAMATAASVIVYLIGRLGFNVDPSIANAALALVGTYVVSQGIADHGKEAAQVAKEINDAAPPSLDADARLAAVEQWVRQNAARSAGGPVSVVAPAGPGGVAKP